jgi:hypothetical protein
MSNVHGLVMVVVSMLVDLIDDGISVKMIGWTHRNVGYSDRLTGYILI